jgi:hypothetical protein
MTCKCHRSDAMRGGQSRRLGGRSAVEPSLIVFGVGTQSSTLRASTPERSTKTCPASS